MTESDSPLTERAFGYAIKWSLIMNVGHQIVNTVAAFVIAAILGPEAYGTVALALVFLAFVQLFLEQGLTTTIIQRKSVTAGHLDAAFWSVLATAIVLLIGTWVLASWWAGVNSAPELDDVLRVMSPIIIIEALTVVQQALLRRALDFKRLAVRANTASVAGGVVGVAAALGGAGVWALVAQQLVTKTVALILLWVVGSWSPGFRVSRSALADIHGFSSRVFLGKAGTFAQSQLDSVIIGVSFGPVAVGLYRIALKVSRTIVDALAKPVVLAALPAFSQNQHDATRLDRSFRYSLQRSAGIVIPVAAGAAAVSDLFFEILGDEWGGAAAVLVVFGFLAAARSVTNLHAEMLMATGRPGSQARLTWTLAAVNAAAFTVAAWLAGGGEPDGQALAMAFARTLPFVVFYLPLTVAITTRGMLTRPADIARTLAPFLLSVPFIVGGSRLAVSFLSSRVGTVWVLVAAIAAGAVFGLPILVTQSEMWRSMFARVLGLVRRQPVRSVSPPVGGER